MPAQPTLVLTRPLTEALQWQQQLQALGQATVVLPLIDIAPLKDVQTLAALEQASAQLSQYRALMFVSPNAVRAFFAAPGMSAALAQALQTSNMHCWAPGPGTCKALRAAGVPERAIDCPPDDATQFDSEALWAVVGAQIQPNDRVLIVRGASAQAQAGVQGSGREWLAGQLQARGAHVEMLAVYARQCPQPTPQLASSIAQCCNEPSVWLFSSSEAIVHLQQLAPQQSWGGQHALVTHPRIAQTAQAAGFRHVRECKPGVMDVRASIESCL